MAVPNARWTAVRRQSLVALAAVAAVVIENARSQSNDIAWQAVALVSIVVALLCLSPVAFAATPRSYRIAATAVALLVTIAAVHGIAAGTAYVVPAAVLAWLAPLLSIKRATTSGTTELAGPG